MNIRRISMTLTAVVVVASAHASPLNLWWEPASDIVSVGQTVSLSVYANTSGTDPIALSDAYLAITWDPTVLTNSTPEFIEEPDPWILSYWSPGNPINSNIQDGDAQRELLGELPPAFPQAPVGVMHDAVNRIKVTTFDFTVKASTSGTSIKLWDMSGGGSTNFYKGDFQVGEWDLAFDRGHYSEATLSTVPEPASLIAFGVGVAAALRRRRSPGLK